MPNESDGSAEPLAALADPRFLVGLIVLVVNDHWLKASHGSWLTGKLSDVAGLIVMPVIVGVVLAVILRRVPNRPTGPNWALAAPAIAVGGTGLWFAAMKTVPAVATATERLFETLTTRPSTIVVDPTDLLGLVGLVVAWSILIEPRPLVAGRTVRAVLFGAGLVACLATSNDEPENYNLFVDQETGDVAYETSYGTFANDQPPVLQLLPSREDIPDAAVQRFTDTTSTQGCTGRAGGDANADVDIETCFQIVGDRIEQRSPDRSGELGEWQTVWRLEPTEAARDQLGAGANYDPSLIIQELAIDKDGRLYVVVDGLWSLVQRQPDGQWQPEAQTYRPAGTVLTFFAALGSLVAIALLGPTRTRRWPLLVGAVGAGIVFVAGGPLVDVLGPEVAFLVGGPPLLLGVVVAVVYLVAWVNWRRWPIAVLSAVIAGVVTDFPLRQWSGNLDLNYRPMLLITMAVSIVAVASAALVGRSFVVAPQHVRQRPIPSEPLFPPPPADPPPPPVFGQRP